MQGVVTLFDEHVGLGVVTATDGATYPFHCTQIEDGTRTVEVGATVEFTVVNERPKGPEAYAVSKTSPL